MEPVEWEYVSKFLPLIATGALTSAVFDCGRVECYKVGDLVRIDIKIKE